MDKSALLEQLHQLSLNAGMNQRFHQDLWTWWHGWDSAIKIILGVVAAFGVVFSIMSALKGRQRLLTDGDGKGGLSWNGLSVTLSVAALVLVVILNIVPFDKDVIHHADMFRRWSDQRREVDALLLESEDGSLPLPLAEEKLRTLSGRAIDINALEYAVSPKKLVSYLEDEEISRGLRDPVTRKSLVDPVTRELTPASSAGG